MENNTSEQVTQPVQPSTPNPVLAPPPPVEPESRFSVPKLALLGIVIIVLLLVVGGAYMLSKSGSSKQTKTPMITPSPTQQPTAAPASPSATPTSTSDDWITYTNPQYNYTIKHPQDITFKEGRFIFKKYELIPTDDLGDTPALKIVAEGVGDPKQVVKNYLEASGTTQFEEIKINNWNGVKLKNSDGIDDYSNYYITSSTITPLVLNIYFYPGNLLDKPDEDFKKADPQGYKEEERRKEEYRKMDEIVKKMLPTLRFLDVKDQAQNWKTHTTSKGVSFKYPNSFEIDEYEKDVFEVENTEHELQAWKFYIDTRQKGINSNYNASLQKINSYLKDKSEKTISGYKVIRGELASEEAVSHFRDTSPNGYNEYSYKDKDDNGKATIVTVALIPYKSGAIEVQTTDNIIAGAWLDEILSNIKF